MSAVKLFTTPAGTVLDLRKVEAVGPARPTGTLLAEDEIYYFEILMASGEKIMCDGAVGESLREANGRREGFITKWWDTQ